MTRDIASLRADYRRLAMDWDYTAYTYDSADGLASIDPPGAANTVAFTLDALGRNRSRAVNGSTLDTYGYVGESETVDLLTRSSGSISAAVDALSERLAISQSSTLGWTLPDLHGSMAAMLNAAGTSVSDAFRYDPYGESAGTSVSGPASPWRFNGNLLLTEAGTTDLYEMGARAYDPALAAFTQQDSVAGKAQNPFSLNRYLFAWASPLNMVDPSGHCARIDNDATMPCLGASTAQINAAIKTAEAKDKAVKQAVTSSRVDDVLEDAYMHRQPITRHEAEQRVRHQTTARTTVLTKLPANTGEATGDSRGPGTQMADRDNAPAQSTPLGTDQTAGADLVNVARYTAIETITDEIQASLFEADGSDGGPALFDVARRWGDAAQDVARDPSVLLKQRIAAVHLYGAYLEAKASDEGNLSSFEAPRLGEFIDLQSAWNELVTSDNPDPLTMLAVGSAFLGLGGKDSNGPAFESHAAAVHDFKSNPEGWTLQSSHWEPARSRQYRGGMSTEEVFTRGNGRIVRHTIYGPNGDVLHEPSFREYAKFGLR